MDMVRGVAAAFVDSSATVERGVNHSDAAFSLVFPFPLSVHHRHHAFVRNQLYNEMRERSQKRQGREEMARENDECLGYRATKESCQSTRAKALSTTVSHATNHHTALVTIGHLVDLG